MKQRVQESRGGPEASQVDQCAPLCGSLAPETAQSDHAADNVLKPEGTDLRTAPARASLLQTEELASSNNKKGLLRWFRRLLVPDSAELRNSKRESLSWLIAYFFTGGTPVAHLVRDVSCSGMYVFTEERWYEGTVVRITMTDRNQPTAERSLTLNARVVRWGIDGVGLEFLLHDGKGADSGLVPTLGDALEPIGRPQLEHFLARLKTGIN